MGMMHEFKMLAGSVGYENGKKESVRCLYCIKCKTYIAHFNKDYQMRPDYTAKVIEFKAHHRKMYK